MSFWGEHSVHTVTRMRTDPRGNEFWGNPEHITPGVRERLTKSEGPGSPT